MRLAALAVLAAAVALLAAPLPARPQGIAEARELYATASYEQALAAFDRLKASESNPRDTALSLEQYRAFCLLALDRRADAERAIEAVYAIDATYRPNEDEASPWVRTVFQDVHRRVLPGLVQQHYAEAKAAFDRKEHAEAALQFARVLALLDDPDLPADKVPVTDMKTLAEGFHALSVEAAKAAAAPPPSREPPPAPATPVAPPAATPPSGPRIYTADDKDVTPPVPIIQAFPPWPSTGGPDKTLEGLIEVIVSESGKVESVAVRGSVSAFYDALLSQRALSWRYRPATRNGERVKYRRLIKFVVPIR